MSILQFKLRPARRDAWLNTKCLTPQLEAQNRFDGDAVKPTARARVPRPTAAARVGWGPIHIGTNHVRLNFVMLHLFSRRGMVDRVDEVPKFHGTIATALQCRRKGDPCGGGGILPAVLANARHISFDVAWLKGTLVERWVEQLDQLVIDSHQSFLNRVH